MLARHLKKREETNLLQGSALSVFVLRPSLIPLDYIHCTSSRTVLMSTAMTGGTHIQAGLYAGLAGHTVDSKYKVSPHPRPTQSIVSNMLPRPAGDGGGRRWQHAHTNLDPRRIRTHMQDLLRLWPRCFFCCLLTVVLQYSPPS